MLTNSEGDISIFFGFGRDFDYPPPVEVPPEVKKPTMAITARNQRHAVAALKKAGFKAFKMINVNSNTLCTLWVKVPGRKK